MKEFLFITIGLICFFACLFFGGCSTQLANEQITKGECVEGCAYLMDKVCPEELAEFLDQIHI